MMVPAGVPEIPSLLRLADILAGPAGRPELAIEAMAAVIERDPANAAHRQRLAELRRAVGIMVRGVTAEAETDPPRACIAFSDALSPRRDIAWADWVRVEPAASVAVVGEDNRLCIVGLAHGRTWRLSLREGLLGADGASLRRPATLEVTIPDRPPRVVLQSGAFILPRGEAPRLTIGTVNLSAVAIRLYRVPERGITGQLGEDGPAFRPLSSWVARKLATARAWCRRAPRRSRRGGATNWPARCSTSRPCSPALDRDCSPSRPLPAMERRGRTGATSPRTGSL